MVPNLALASTIVCAIVLAPSAAIAGQTTYQGSCLGVVERIGKEPTAFYDCDRVTVADGVSYPDESIDFRFYTPKGNGIMFVTDRGHVKVGEGTMYKLRSYSSLDTKGVISEPQDVTGFCEIGVKVKNNVACTAQMNGTKLSIVLTPKPKKQPKPARVKVYRSLEAAQWGDE